MEDKAEASTLSEDQIEGLKKYHITSSLYYSPPTTTHYVDREAVIKNGEIAMIINTVEEKRAAIANATHIVVPSEGTRDELVRLWVHESMRVFGDRLTEDVDRDWFLGRTPLLTSTTSNSLYSVLRSFVFPSALQAT
jgi:hypothetical protein